MGPVGALESLSRLLSGQLGGPITYVLLGLLLVHYLGREVRGSLDWWNTRPLRPRPPAPHRKSRDEAKRPRRARPRRRRSR
jgi:hypothetical protein